MDIINKLPKKIIFLSIFLGIILVAGCTRTSDSNNENGSNGPINYGENFEFTLVDGTPAKMEQFAGKVVLLDFFGVRCQPCQLQMQVLYEIYNDYSHKDFEIVSINVWILSGEKKRISNIECQRKEF